MKKVALVFVVAVVAPSLVLAWLALRSLRDQELVSDRQQTLLYQGVADGLAHDIENHLGALRREFGKKVEDFTCKPATHPASTFSPRLREVWPLAEVGFVVSAENQVLAPSPLDGALARQFRLENERFLCSREAAEVYWNTPKGQINFSKSEKEGVSSKVEPEPPGKSDPDVKSAKIARKVVPEKEAQPDGATSKIAAEEAEFRRIVGDSTEGTVARFLQNKLKLLFWYRSPCEPGLVFGAQLDLAQLATNLRDAVKVEEGLNGDICAALLDDGGRPLAFSHPDFTPGLPPVGGVVRQIASVQPTATLPTVITPNQLRNTKSAPNAAARKAYQTPDWKHPFVAAEIGEALPHWEVAVYRLDPTRASRAAASARLTLGLLVGLLVMAITIGSWLIVADLRRQLTLARQKTDFVSNVSHELKTPLTSIRMFSEMLAEGRVQDDEKRRHFLGIITAEAARLTRLINNVLDFARLERGEKKYDFAPCDFTALARETIDSYRPHLEATGFVLRATLPSVPIPIHGDRDALAQVLVNLLSNAEKYSGEPKEIDVELATEGDRVELRVLDRGLGVPRGCEENIFEQFFRAHDSLGSGIQGSGLGLTLARQIARAHGGDVTYRAREGGGSCFALRLPVEKT